MSLNRETIEVLDVKTVLSHEYESRAKTGDLLYTILYKTKSGMPITD